MSGLLLFADVAAIDAREKRTVPNLEKWYNLVYQSYVTFRCILTESERKKYDSLFKKVRNYINEIRKLPWERKIKKKSVELINEGIETMDCLHIGLIDAFQNRGRKFFFRVEGRRDKLDEALGK